MDHGEHLELAARLGYGARGVVYLLIGGFALAAALGLGLGEDPTQDTRSVLGGLIDAPAGRVALAAIALGLLGYATWRFYQALANPDAHAASPKGYAVRAAMAVSGVVHLGIAYYAARLAWTSGAGPSGDSTQQSFAAELLMQPAGQWLVAGVGVAIAGAGIAQIVKGWRAGFLKHFVQTPRWSVGVCRFGLAARGVVFLMVGGFFVNAAISADPYQAGGMEGALEVLRHAGTPIFATVAAGLVAFAAYSFLEAVYRRVDPDAASRRSARPRAPSAPGRVPRRSWP